MFYAGRDPQVYVRRYDAHVQQDDVDGRRGGSSAARSGKQPCVQAEHKATPAAFKQFKQTKMKALSRQRLAEGGAILLQNAKTPKMIDFLWLGLRDLYLTDV